MVENEETIKLLKEAVKWLRILSLQTIKKVAQDALSKNEQKLVYHYSDGRGTLEISKLVEVNPQTVANYWNSWNKIGIVEEMNVRGGKRYKKLFELDYFDIDLPKIKMNTNAENKTDNIQNLNGDIDIK
jgi:hypothetical protein